MGSRPMIDRLTGPTSAPPPATTRVLVPVRSEDESRQAIRCRLERDLAGRGASYGPDGRRRVPVRAMFVATYC
jgi:hypothetical protein